MAVKLHRCKNIWVKNSGHPCWRVQSSLDEQRIDYEVVKERWRGERPETMRKTRQRKFPWIEFEDGSVYREESKDMRATIQAGKLDEKRGASAVEHG